MAAKRLIRIASFLMAAMILTTGVTSAAGEEESGRIERARSVLDTLKGAHDMLDVSGATTQLRELVAVHNELETAAWRSKLQEQACKMVRDRDWAQVRALAARALTEIDDPKRAWKHLRKAMPSRKMKSVDAAGLAVLDAVGKLAPDGAITSLVALMRKAKDVEAMKGAIRALGGFGRSKRRVLVLEEVLGHLKKSRPSRAPGKRIGQETRRRWNAIRGLSVASLNRLTGRRESGVDIWLDLFKEHKKTLKTLFRE